MSAQTITRQISTTSFSSANPDSVNTVVKTARKSIIAEQKRTIYINKEPEFINKKFCSNKIRFWFNF